MLIQLSLVGEGFLVFKISISHVIAFALIVLSAAPGFVLAKVKIECVQMLSGQQVAGVEWSDNLAPYTARQIRITEVLSDPFVQYAMASDSFREFISRLSTVLGGINIDYKNIADAIPRYNRSAGPSVPQVKSGARNLRPNELSNAELLKYITSNYDLNPIGNTSAVLIEIRKQMRKVESPLIQSGALENFKHIRGGVEAVQALFVELLRVTPNSTRGSLLPVPNAYIASGGRFDETYFWDSFWIMKGLIESGFGDLAKGIFENWVYIFEQYGIISNGNRIYYLSRTQPPFFVEMMTLLWQNGFLKFDKATFQKKGSLEIRALRVAKQYYTKIWRGTERFSSEHGLFRYSDGIRGQKSTTFSVEQKQELWIRPESSRRELRTDETIAKRIFAESGWDMSYTRFGNEPENHLPVDLNSILAGYTADLSKIFAAVGDKSNSIYFFNESQSILIQMDKYLFNSELDLYFDYNTRAQSQTSTYSAAQFYPFYFGVYGLRSTSRVVLQNLYRKLKQIGDLSVRSTDRDGEGQWDGEWTWAPLVDITFQSLIRLKLSGEAKELALDYCFMVLRAYYKNKHQFFEKYRARDGSIQIPANSEIYGNEVGFGWTNSVLISLLRYLKDQGLLAQLELRLVRAKL